MITKTYTDIIKEASQSEDFNVTDLITDELKTKYSDCVHDMPVIDKNLVAYSAGMVPVFKHESTYYVELGNVAKYMMEAEVNTVQDALEDIATSNDINLDSIALVIESKSYMESVLQEAIRISKLGDNSLLESCELSVKLIDELKSQGIKVVATK